MALSHFIETFNDRGKVMMEEPGLYTILNFFSLGFLETVEGAFLPEEPLSLEHLLDIAGVVTAVYGVAKVTKGIATKRGKTAKAKGGKGKRLFEENSNLDDGLNFTMKAAEHMEDLGRRVPVQTLQAAIRSGHVLPDPRGSNANMYYSIMTKNGKLYNLEVLYDEATNNYGTGKIIYSPGIAMRDSMALGHPAFHL